MHIVMWFGGLMPIHLIKYEGHMRANLVLYWPHLNLCSEPVLSFVLLTQHLNCGVSKQLELNDCRDPGSV